MATAKKTGKKAGSKRKSADSTETKRTATKSAAGRKGGAKAASKGASKAASKSAGKAPARKKTASAKSGAAKRASATRGRPATKRAGASKAPARKTKAAGAAGRKTGATRSASAGRGGKASSTRAGRPAAARGGAAKRGRDTTAKRGLTRKGAPKTGAPKTGARKTGATAKTRRAPASRGRASQQSKAPRSRSEGGVLAASVQRRLAAENARAAAAPSRAPKGRASAGRSTSPRAAESRGGTGRAGAARGLPTRAPRASQATPDKAEAPRSRARRGNETSRPGNGTPGLLDVAARTVKRAARRLASAVAPQEDEGSGLEITGPMGPRFDEVLTPDALAFVADLHRTFDARRRELLEARRAQQERYDAGELPDFLPETQEIRDGDWRVAPIPQDLLDRRVEITGPVDRKMIINALNSGAEVFMADFEDANSPTWENNIDGQINLKDRWAGELDFTDPTSGREYRLGNRTAVLIIRPRGWHLLEEHLKIDGEPVSGSLFDFGLYFFHNARALSEQGTGPYFYLPKLETHEEARLWNDVFVHAQEKLGIPQGTIRATVLIETLPAAFEMDEILWELRDHIAGLNAGRWDYIFSFIKKLASNPDYVLPDRGQVVMGKAFLLNYAQLLVKTCHRRGAFAMGGMAAQIPVRNDPAANEAAFERVRADKEREVNEGHDGTWVAHPDLVPVAKEVFEPLEPNQLNRQRDDVNVTQEDLLRVHEGTKTEEGFRHNIRVGVQYIEAWLRGRGAVPIYNMMEDAATAEISRAQIWQWIKYGVELDTGEKATPELFRRALGEEMERVKGEIGAENYDRGRFPEAIQLFSDLSLAPQFEDFLTIPAYRLIA